jgi:diketogulonate reductase-like aldo/keto reductase
MPKGRQVPETFDVGGVSIPSIGFGTFQGDDGNGQVKNAVLAALRNGFRHIDTAAAYGNEKEVGQAIKESGLLRTEIFVTTKLYETLLRHLQLPNETNLTNKRTDMARSCGRRRISRPKSEGIAA